MLAAVEDVISGTEIYDACHRAMLDDAPDFLEVGKDVTAAAKTNFPTDREGTVDRAPICDFLDATAADDGIEAIVDGDGSSIGDGMRSESGNVDRGEAALNEARLEILDGKIAVGVLPNSVTIVFG